MMNIPEFYQLWITSGLRRAVTLWDQLKFRTTEPSNLMVLISIVTICITFIVWISLLRKRKSSKTPPVPPGSSGIPFIGDTFAYVKAYADVTMDTFISRKVVKYGSVFKMSIMGAPVVVLDWPSGNKLMFHNEVELLKGYWPKSVRSLVNSNGVSDADGEPHRIFRQHLTKNFLGVDVVHRYLRQIDKAVINVLRPLQEKEDGTQIKLHLLANEYLLNVVCDLVMSINDKSEIEELKSNFTTWSLGFMGVPINLPGTVYNRALKAKDVLLKQIGQRIQKRKRELEEGLATSTQDLMSLLLTHPDGNGDLVGEKMLESTLLLMLWASYDTQSSTICMVLRQIAKHPEVYEELIKEHASIASGKDDEEGLTIADIRAMRYTWQVVQETMRLYPVLHGVFREARTTFNYKGFTIPKGWKLLATTNSMKDPKLFKNSEMFDPSRFETVNGGAPPFSYFPFGGGHRMCPGIEFAKLSMLTFLHHFLRNFKWSLVYPDERITYAFLPTAEHGAPIVFTKVTVF